MSSPEVDLNKLHGIHQRSSRSDSQSPLLSLFFTVSFAFSLIDTYFCFEDACSLLHSIYFTASAVKCLHVPSLAVSDNQATAWLNYMISFREQGKKAGKQEKASRKVTESTSGKSMFTTRVACNNHSHCTSRNK